MPENKKPSITRASNALAYIIDGLEIQVVYIHGKKTNLIVALSDIHQLLNCLGPGGALNHATNSLNSMGIPT